MANRLPIYSRQFITLHKAEVVQAFDAAGPQYDVNNQPLAPSFYVTPWYVNSTLILGVREYFDIQTRKYYDYRVITVGGPFALGGEVVVRETKAEIEAIIDDIDCNDLCPEDPTTPPA